MGEASSHHRPSPEDVRAAADRISDKLKRTPVVNEPSLDERLGCRLWLKCENLQETGSFKLRGASNAVACLAEQGYQGDVATHSSGNHGAALALAATRADRRAQVVMPSNSVQAKIDSVRRNGGDVILCEPTQAAREAGLADLVAQGYEPIPPYDHPDIIAGQGTSAMELLNDHPDLEVLVAPVGGGGLLAGCALAAASHDHELTVIGAEPAGAADAHASLEGDQRVLTWQPDTIADGLRAVIGQINFEIIRESVSRIFLASDDESVEAMKLVYQTTGLKIEPSSAVAIAVIRNNPGYFTGRSVGVIVTGGNYDPDLFPWLDHEHE